MISHPRAVWIIVAVALGVMVLTAVLGAYFYYSNQPVVLHAP